MGASAGNPACATSRGTPLISSRKIAERSWGIKRDSCEMTCCGTSVTVPREESFRDLTAGLLTGIELGIFGSSPLREFLCDCQLYCTFPRFSEQTFHLALCLFLLLNQHHAQKRAAHQVANTDVDLPVARSHLDPHEAEAIACQGKRHDHGRITMVCWRLPPRDELSGSNGGAFLRDFKLRPF